MSQYDKAEATSTPPWGPNDRITPPAVEAGLVAEDGLHTSYRVPCPGSRSNAVRLPDLVLLNPTNTGTCPCSLFIASCDASGAPLGTLELRPGDTSQIYQAEPGAAFIGVACSKGCTFPDCFGELTVSVSAT